MLSISMLLFCIAKLNLILGTLLPTYIRTRQKHQAETTLIQYHNKYKTIINPNGTTDIREKIANYYCPLNNKSVQQHSHKYYFTLS